MAISTVFSTLVPSHHSFLWSIVN